LDISRDIRSPSDFQSTGREWEKEEKGRTTKRFLTRFVSGETSRVKLPSMMLCAVVTEICMKA